MLTAWFLGQYRVSVHGTDIDLAHSRKARSLFAYLITHNNRRFAREVLADTLWGDQQIDSQKTFRQELWTIRNALRATGANPDAILGITGEEIGLAAGFDIMCDALLFDAETRDAERQFLVARESIAIDMLRRAAELYRGEFLPGHYDDWSISHREALRLRHLNALEILMMHHRALEEWDGAITMGTQLLSIDPLLEHVHRSLILCHYRKGNRAGAIAQFETCKKVLMRELGIHPMRETVEAYEIVKSERPISPIRHARSASFTQELTNIRASLDAANRGLAKLMQELPPTN